MTRIGEEDLDPLSKGTVVNREVSVGLTEERGGRSLWFDEWGDESETFEVSIDGEQEQLKIGLYQLDKKGIESQDNVMMSRAERGALTCNASRLLAGATNGKIIYQGNTEEGNVFGKIPVVDIYLSVNISLNKCAFKEKENEVECSLKVVTGIKQLI